MSTLNSPRIIDGRWVLGQSAGPGGQSQVYRAVDADGARAVIKLLPAPERNDRYAMKAFDLEVRARMAPLVHPHIVPLLDHGADPETGERYLVFPDSGRTMTAILADRGAIGWDEWWTDFARPILDALALAHRRDVAHRDVKPDNVLVDDGGLPRLTDFGVAKLLGQQVQAGLTMAEHVSRPFAPPEPDIGMHSRSRDLYAWAAMAYFAISGNDPTEALSATDPYAVLERAAEAAQPHIPGDVNKALRRCLDEPQRRPPVAQALLDELDEMCSTGTETRGPSLGRVPIVVPPTVEQRLEEDYDLLSAGVRDLLLRSLADVVVMPHGQGSSEYRLVGNLLSLHVRVTSDGRQLQLVRSVRLPSEQLDRDRERGWPATVEFTFDRVDDLEAADAISAFQAELVAHRDEAQRRRQARQRMRPLTKWRQILGAMRDLQDRLADPVEYTDVRRSPRGRAMMFLVKGDEIQRMLGQQRIAAADGGATFVGQVVSFSGGEAVLHPLERSARDPNIEGSLRLDTRGAISALRRQSNALDSVQYEHAVRPDLAELLAVPATATPAEQVHEPTLRQDLDDDKRTALRTALSRPDLMIVKGPPGTGKTRFIVELVYQTLQRDPTCRVLIASQTHAALDNALARIRQLDGTLKLLRFARTDEERVAEAVADLRLDAQLEKWQAEVKRQGDAWLNRWATEAGVEPDAVWAAMTLEELAAEIEAIQRLQENIATVQKQRDSLHSRNTDPGSTSATADALRVLADENDELREKLRSAESRGRDLLAQLITRGELSRRTRLGKLVANDLRGRASALAPDTSEGRRCRELIDLLAQWHARFGTTSEFIVAALARAQIVGATCVGLGGIRGLNDIEFGLCIVDEASRATAPELMIPMSRSRRFVLVGDEQQLPPHFDHDLRDTKLLESLGLGVEDLDESFFSHLSDGLPRENVVELNLQHRMSPAIARLVSYCFYGQRLRSVQDEEPYDRNLCLVAPRPVTWFTTSRLAGRWETRRGDSIVNEVEIAEIKRLLGEIAGAAAKRSGSTEVVILAGYRAQCEALRGRLAVEMGDTGPLIASVHTVDAFQGQEADVVIYSVTRSNRQGKLGFIRERPRLNVALSRARELLLIVGDHASARRRGGDNPMRDVVEHVEAHPADCAMVEVSG